jgi:hypothetical protein
MAIDQGTGIKLHEDRSESGIWRVEYFDDEGGCYVAVFAGPKLAGFDLGQIEHDVYP